MFAADGARLVRVDDDGVTVFLPGGQEVRSDGAGVSATRWYTFAGSVVATRTGVGMGAVASVVTDAHGTPVAHVHNTNWAAPVNRVRTDPFGNARAGQAGTLAGRGFLGAPADPTGLTLLGARFYDPATGTFVSVDPLLDPMLPAQFNAYVYSGNNPLTWADPTGEAWQMDPNNPRASSINTGLATVVASHRADDRGSCSVGDWSCRVSAAEDEVDCGGAGKFPGCKEQPGAGLWSYDYMYDHAISTNGRVTPAEAMRMFQMNPRSIFPFKVQGCDEFVNGVECHLYTGTPLLNPDGTVGVTTTATSTTFTVIERGYFDAPGSTIEFSTWEDSNGVVYLRQTAHGRGADVFTWVGLKLFRAALPTWEDQAARLSNLLESSR